MQTIRCKKCGNDRSECDFYTMHSKSKTGKIYTYRRTPCKFCITHDCEVWRNNNKERHLKSIRTQRHKRKIELLELMGNKCICCGITQYWNLTFDHIIPLRRKTPQRESLIYKLLNNPELRKNFQIMCYGCNISKNTHEKCTLDHSLTKDDKARSRELQPHV